MQCYLCKVKEKIKRDVPSTLNTQVTDILICTVNETTFHKQVDFS